MPSIKPITLIIVLLASALGANSLYPRVTDSLSECVINGGFENLFNGWSVSSGTVTTSTSHSGSYSAQIGQITQGFTGITTLNIQSAGFWYKGGQVSFLITFKNGGFSSAVTSSSSIWTYYNLLSFTQASGTQLVSIQFSATSTFLDDVSIQTTTLPPLSSVSVSPTYVQLSVGSSQLFTSTVVGGTPPFSYQWYWMGSPVSGATNSTWLLTAVNAGNLYLTVTDSLGVTVTSNTVDVSLSISAQTYMLSLTVQDQVGNLLPATVTVGTTTATCNSAGQAQVSIGAGTQTISVSIRTGINTYSGSKTVSITANTVLTVVLYRRFYWQFYLNYTDGSLASGTLTAVESNETLTVQVSNGYAIMYLLNGRVTFSFVSTAPAITFSVSSLNPYIALQTTTINNDGFFYGTINKQSGTVVTATNQTSSAFTPPSATGIALILLNPNTPIYILLGIIVIVFISAGVVRARHRRQTK